MNQKILRLYKTLTPIATSIFVVAIIFLLSTLVYAVNSAPTVDSVYVSATANAESDISGGVTLVSNATKTVHLNGKVSDIDGYTDIGAVKAWFFRSGVSGGSSCVVDDNDCYIASPVSCTLSNGSGNTLDYNCPVNVQYFADSTQSGDYSGENWDVRIDVGDIGGPATTTDESYDGIEVNDLLAVSFSGAIDYGTMALGATSTAVLMEVYNTGNKVVDVELEGTNMTCTTGGIHASKQRYSSSTVVYADRSILPHTTQTTKRAHLDLPQRTGSSVSDNLYWQLQLPELNAGGSCSGTNTINAVSP